MSENSENTPHRQAEHQKSKTLEAAGWGLLLLWLGITTLFSFGWPVFLIGLGLLVLAIQAIRVRWNLGAEAFWMVLGVVFVVAGIVESFGTGFPLVPVALILFGAIALYGAFKRIGEHHS